MSQRIIKFRAWDIKEKRMVTVDDLLALWTNNNHEGDVKTIPRVTVVNQSYSGIDKHLIVDKDCYLMQFTGLLDKNGKEIYEGDIVRFWNPGKIYPNKKKIKSIIWKGHKKGTGFNIGSNIKGSYEIIGNIYEKPELLTK